MNVVSKDIRTRLDPVTLEVIRNAMPAISNEMSYDLQRTSYNMMIYEVCDYSCTLLDTDGTLQFRPDVYNRDQEILPHLYRMRQAPVAERDPASQRRG